MSKKSFSLSLKAIKPLKTPRPGRYRSEASHHNRPLRPLDCARPALISESVPQPTKKSAFPCKTSSSCFVKVSSSTAPLCHRAPEASARDDLVRSSSLAAASGYDWMSPLETVARNLQPTLRLWPNVALSDERAFGFSRHILEFRINLGEISPNMSLQRRPSIG